MKRKLAVVIAGAVVLSMVAACGGRGAGDAQRIVLAAYTTPREAYGEIIPIFQARWAEESEQAVVFEESYLGSGAQSRAVVEGFEADIVALSLEADVLRIVNAGLITHDWHNAPYNGMVSTSIVAFAVREGNPKNIRDWADLARPGIEVLTPNPRTSGGAMWNILALYGAALRGQVDGVAGNDPAAARAFMEAVLRNVSVMDGTARDSITNFEKGVGDVAISYENEVLVGQQSGQTYELVIPRSTIRIDNPVALVDANVDKHGNCAATEAFRTFLFTPQAQQIFAKHGLRSVDPEVAAATAAQYPPVADLFNTSYFGGWGPIVSDIFGDNGVFTLAVNAVYGQ